MLHAAFSAWQYISLLTKYCEGMIHLTLTIHYNTQFQNSDISQPKTLHRHYSTVIALSLLLLLLPVESKVAAPLPKLELIP